MIPNEAFDYACGNNSRPNVVIPTGYEQIRNGLIEIGDLVWLPNREAWHKVDLVVGHPVKDFFAVCRYSKRISRRRGV